MFNIGVSPKLVMYLVGLFLALLSILYHFVRVSGLEDKVAKAEKQTVEFKIRSEQLETALTSAMEANAEFQQSINTQNQQIVALQRGARLHRQAAEDAVAQVREEYARKAKSYARILSNQPPYPNDLCASLKERLREYNAARVLELAK